MIHHTLLVFASSFIVSPLAVLASSYSMMNTNSTTYQFQKYGAKPGDDGKKINFSYSIAQVPRFNSRVKLADNEGRRLHSTGIWNEAGERLRFRAGQGIHFEIVNHNIFTVDVNIREVIFSRGDNQQTVVIPPFGKRDIVLSVFGEEPITWDLLVTTLVGQTDLGFLVSWKLFSTWVPKEQSDEKQIKSSPESETKLPKAESCQTAVDRVLGLTRSKGAKFTQFRVYRNVGIQYYENPTSRSDKIIIDLRDTMAPGRQIVAQKILNKQEMQAWANRIALSCGNTGIVTFGIYGTDGFTSYFFHGDGLMKEAICRDPDRGSYEKKYKWGVELCL
jgi:hypothetical protein